VSRATTRALSTLEAERALRADAGRVQWPARPVVSHAAQACSVLWPGHGRPSALWARAELDFGLDAI
jgi:hypothetical protein